MCASDKWKNCKQIVNNFPLPIEGEETLKDPLVCWSKVLYSK